MSICNYICYNLQPLMEEFTRWQTSVLHTIWISKSLVKTSQRWRALRFPTNYWFKCQNDECLYELKSFPLAFFVYCAKQWTLVLKIASSFQFHMIRLESYIKDSTSWATMKKLCGKFLDFQDFFSVLSGLNVSFSVPHLSFCFVIILFIVVVFKQVNLLHWVSLEL